MVATFGALRLLDPNGDGWDHMGGWGGGWMWLWGLAMMVLFAVLVVWLIRTVTASSSSAPPVIRDASERGREILGERYARGELSTEEYRERVNELH